MLCMPLSLTCLLLHTQIPKGEREKKKTKGASLTLSTAETLSSGPKVSYSLVQRSRGRGNRANGSPFVIQLANTIGTQT